MEKYPVLSTENYSQNNRYNLKTLDPNLNSNKGSGHKSHLNLFQYSKRPSKYLKTLTI